MPATPVPVLEHHVHFSPVNTPGEASETEALGQHHGHQDPQANDPFVGHEGNIIADTHTQVCFYFYFKSFF